MKRLLLEKEDSTMSDIDKSEKTVTIKSPHNSERRREDVVKVTALTSDAEVNEFIKKEEERKFFHRKSLEDNNIKKDQSLQTTFLEVQSKKMTEDPSQHTGGKISKPDIIIEKKQQYQEFFKRKLEEAKEKNENSSYIIDRSREKQFKYPIENFIVEKRLIQNQKEVTIENQKMYFPYEPYEVQVEYMRNVILALNNKSNALLESPTGTGKTLCLLSSVLSWVEDCYFRTRVKTKVIYMSRTHSQLKQVHKQLEKTCYRPNMAIFASREQLCIKQQLSQLKGKQKVQACGRGVKIQRKLRRQENNGSQKETDPKILQAACQYHKEREEVAGIAKRRLMNVLLDIPTMRKIGVQEQFCPYFYPHNAKNHANLFLMPYNYLLDAYLLTTYSELINDSIIIFDEAHNVAEAACEGRSLILETSNIEAALLELNGILSNYASKALMEVRLTYEKQIKFILRNLEYYKENFINFANENFPSKNQFYQRQSWQKEETEAKIFNQERTDEAIFQMFCGKVIRDERKGEFDKKQDFYRQEMRTRLLNPLKEIVQYGELIIEALKETPDGFCTNFEKFFIFINKVSQLLLPMVYRPRGELWLETQINHFRLYIQKNQTNPNYFTFGLRCLVPWLTFQNIMKCQPRSIILTSGTLKPLEMWEKELQLKFAYKLINNHVIKKEQINSRIICSGPSQSSFTFTFDNMNRNKDTIYKDLIETLVQICSHIPNGVLLVFPSFRLQNEFRVQFNKSPKKHRLLEFKDLIFQEKNNDTDMLAFKKKALSAKGAVLAMICRGKLSEGIDFPDGMCRAVIIVGIPYPNIKDPFIIQKRNHLENIARKTPNKSQVIRGEEWYFMGTIRSINQALGRVIRHALDFGMIFLIDKRYRESKFSKELPGWVTEGMQTVDAPDHDLYSEISTFYKDMKTRYHSIEPELVEQQKQQNIPTNLSFLHKRMNQDEPEKKNSFSILMKNRGKFMQKKKGTSDFI